MTLDSTPAGAGFNSDEAEIEALVVEVRAVAERTLKTVQERLPLSTPDLIGLLHDDLRDVLGADATPTSVSTEGFGSYRAFLEARVAARQIREQLRPGHPDRALADATWQATEAFLREPASTTTRALKRATRSTRGLSHMFGLKLPVRPRKESPFKAGKRAAAKVAAANEAAAKAAAEKAAAKLAEADGAGPEPAPTNETAVKPDANSSPLGATGLPRRPGAGPSPTAPSRNTVSSS